jgi:cyclase
MLCRRIIPTLLYRDATLVKGQRFDSWRSVGSPQEAIRVYNMREVDELVFLDISATRNRRSPDFELIDEIADDCFAPLAVGGGIRSLADVQGLLAAGADKVVVNTGFIENPELIRAIADKFGSQSLMVSLDARPMASGGWEAVSHSGERPTGRDAVALARRAEEMGAGEILITSIPHDGLMQGYDCALVTAVTGAVSIPVIAAGGAGAYRHFAEVLEASKAQAVAAASMFHFTEQTPLGAKRYLAEKGFPVRL